MSYWTLSPHGGAQAHPAIWQSNTATRLASSTVGQPLCLNGKSVCFNCFLPLRFRVMKRIIAESLMSGPTLLSVTIGSQFIIGGSFTSWNIKPLYDIKKKRCKILISQLWGCCCAHFFYLCMQQARCFSLFPAFMRNLAASRNFIFTKHHQSSHQLHLFPKMHIVHNLCILRPCYWIKSQLKSVVTPNGERKMFCRRLERLSHLRQWFTFVKMLLWKGKCVHRRHLAPFDAVRRFATQKWTPEMKRNVFALIIYFSLSDVLLDVNIWSVSRVKPSVGCRR